MRWNQNAYYFSEISLTPPPPPIQKTKQNEMIKLMPFVKALVVLIQRSWTNHSPWIRVLSLLDLNPLYFNQETSCYLSWDGFSLTDVVRGVWWILGTQPTVCSVTAACLWRFMDKPFFFGLYTSISVIESPRFYVTLFIKGERKRSWWCFFNLSPWRHNVVRLGYLTFIWLVFIFLPQPMFDVLINFIFLVGI